MRLKAEGDYIPAGDPFYEPFDRLKISGVEIRLGEYLTLMTLRIGEKDDKAAEALLSQKMC